MEMILIYTTCATADEADQIARTLVQERLVACANRGEKIFSQYMWEGQLESGPEIPLLLKTRAALFERVRQRLRVLHSYKTPAIIALPAAQADPDYVAWVEQMTQVGA